MTATVLLCNSCLWQSPISVDIPRGSPPNIPNQTWNLQVICWTPWTQAGDLATAGFTRSINSWEIVQLIKMITTQLLPAAGLLPFVFTQSCEVKEVGESCRYVCLAVWISGIWYPKVFSFLYYPPSLEKLKEEEKFWKIILHHLIWGWQLTQTVRVWQQAWISVSSSSEEWSFSSCCFWPKWNGFCPKLKPKHTDAFTMWCLFWVWQIFEGNSYQCFSNQSSPQP